MLRKIHLFTVILAVTLLLSGCMATLDQMYCLPKRSEEVKNLQSVLDSSMAGLEYCAPLSGENQQTVQMADLNGDGVQEFLVFAKGTADKPLKILVISHAKDSYVLDTVIESNGFAFDQVEYVQMDGTPGLEIVVGCQVSNQILRNVSVYSYSGTLQKLVTANYSKYLTVDLDQDTLHELLILRPGQTDSDNGVAELYGMEDGAIIRSNEAIMSEPVNNLKRILSSKLQGGQPAVYVASAVDEKAIITDVYAMVDGAFRNVSLSNESGTSVQTLRNYYVYATDIDDDGVVELPDLISMTPLEIARSGGRQYLIRWYAMNIVGAEVDKLFTFHNYAGGWYFQLNPDWVSRITVIQNGDGFEFYIWNETYDTTEKMLTIYVLRGPNREQQAEEDGRFVLYRGESVVYSALLEPSASTYGIKTENVIHGFHLIQMEWKTGETE